MHQCGAITYDGGICKRLATHNGRCHWHGGLSSKADEPQPGGGKWTNALPYDLVARYERTHNDPNRLSVQGEIALIDARIEDLLNRVSTSESQSAWGDLRDAYEKMMHGREYGLYEQENTYRAHINNIINGALNASTSWINIQALIEQRRRLVECEQRTAILTLARQRQQAAAAIIDAYTAAIQRYVSDPETCAAIHAEADKLLNT
jgi:hypothetical protein